MNDGLLLGLLSLLFASAPALGQDDVPLERLGKRDRADVERVHGDATVDATVRPVRVRCRRAVYRALLTDLPLSSRWLRALRLGDYDIRETPGGFSIDDKAGATARCRRALDEDGLLVVVAPGRLSVSVLPTIKGTGIIVVRYAEVVGKKDLLEARAGVAFRVESGVLHAMTRPFERVLRRVLTEKMSALIKSASALGEAIQRDPAGTFEKLRQAGVGEADLKAFRQRFLAL